MTRRQVNGYEWRHELDAIHGLGERMATRLVEMSQSAPTVQASRQYIELVGMSSQVSIKALKLKDYKAVGHEHTPTPT